MRRETGQHRKRLGVILIVLGCGLLAITAIGIWTHMGKYRDYPPRPWERFDPSLVGTTRDLDALYQAGTARAEHPFRELPPGDVSYVLIRLASKAGIPSHHVLLNGHIAMEAWYSGIQNAYDPDLEVAVKDPDGIVLDAEMLFGKPDLLRHAYAGRGSPAFLDNLVSNYISRKDNLIKTYPAEAGITVKGQRPGRVEQAARYGRVLLPTAMLLIGAYLAGVPRR